MQMRAPRRGHSCTAVYMQNDHKSLLVVGGITGDGPTGTAESLEPHLPDAEWEFVESLPGGYTVHGAQFVDSKGKPLLVGGSTDQKGLFQLVGDHWDELDEEQQRPKMYAVAFVADETVLHACD